VVLETMVLLLLVSARALGVPLISLPAAEVSADLDARLGPLAQSRLQLSDPRKHVFDQLFEEELPALPPAYEALAVSEDLGTTQLSEHMDVEAVVDEQELQQPDEAGTFS